MGYQRRDENKMAAARVRFRKEKKEGEAFRVWAKRTFSPGQVVGKLEEIVGKGDRDAENENRNARRGKGGGGHGRPSS